MRIRGLFVIILIFLFSGLFAQIAINADGDPPNNSAMLDVSSTSMGLLIPSMTTAQRNAIVSPANGLLVYDINTRSFWYYNVTSAEWQKVGNSVARATEINELTDGKTSAKSVFLGSFSGFNDDGTDNNNTALGRDAFRQNVSGNNNAAIGYSSLKNSTGNGNAALGSYSMNDNTSGTSNVAIGRAAMYFNTVGNFNVAVGMNANLNNQEGSQNTIIGQGAGHGAAVHNKSGNVFLGYQAGYSETTDNKLYIQNSNATFPLIYGDFASNLVGFNANVGIGTKNPEKNLHVVGSSTLASVLISPDQAVSGGASELLFAEDDDFSYGMSIKYDGSNDKLLFYGKSSATILGPHLTIERAGSVGVGTSNPNELFEVASPTNDYGRMIVSDGGGDSRNALLFVSPKAATQSARIEAYNYGTSTGLTLNFNTVGDGKSIFGGQVGIGTSNPKSQLHVHDPNSSNSTLYITPKANVSNDSSTIFMAEDKDAAHGIYWLYDGVDNQLELWGQMNTTTTYGPHLLIDRTSGDIAIGGENFATGYKLSVEGKVICEELRVNLQADWPDYVFAKDYKLMPINNLGDYISENAHLPNIPSSDEMHESGLEVGEMQRLMMEKIEELTLYIVEQQKQIDELVEQVNKTSIK